MTTDNRTNEPNKYAGFIARQNHQRDPWRGIGKKCLCGVVFDSDVDHAMHQVDEILRAALVTAQGVAPVLPSSTVDEEAIAARICEKNYVSPDGKPYCLACYQSPYGHAPWPCPTVAALDTGKEKNDE